MISISIHFEKELSNSENLIEKYNFDYQ